ncbi:membrane-bound metal-dependent hydrolase YbcI (DUF457 family) [Methanomicrobium sp. W14]|uniref:metal-dependent hydrolase n=1 Tax=Methanomicrobium sp. W14 TaxID=2817839 RepID=UPI001AEA27DD|nr:metal-dependent hydrolase [Methanomicrobium sp. W14]MBP2134162.1 membrane-bound metal-dependent hydrolase YbcI (DUF457 family) [Methanomicrobium sp. W14]
MRGEQHVFFSLLSAAVFFPLIYGRVEDILLIPAVFGIFIGSLAPDADAADSAIMHGLMGGRGGARKLRRHTVLILPVFGYIIRYFIYYPVSLLVYIFTLGRIRPKHRGLLHSMLGIAAASVLLWVYICIASKLITNDFMTVSIPAGVFCAGVLSGSFLHLLEDSCTHEGVFWLFPLSCTKVSGTVAPGSRRYWLIALVIGVTAVMALFFALDRSIKNTTEIILPFVLFVFEWSAVFLISGVHRG